MEQLDTYDKWKIDILTERSALSDAKIEGLIEGEAKGEAKGIARGVAIGEQKKALIIARNLLKKGMSIEDVSEMTGLSETQIEEFQIHNHYDTLS